MTDERLYTELHQFVATADDLTHGIRQGHGTIGKLLKDPAAANALEASLQNIEGMTQQINVGAGQPRQAAEGRCVRRVARNGTANIRDVTARINKGDGTAGS